MSLTISTRPDAPRKLRKNIFIAALVLLVLCLAALPLRAQNGPMITMLNPPSLPANGQMAMLTVIGTGFANNSKVRVNGVDHMTVFQSSMQLMATLLPADTQSPTSLSITVFNPVAGIPNGGQLSNAVPLPITIALPTLTSATPGTTTPGANGVRLTLVGTNFRPGARVVISPPLASLMNSTASQQATDIAIESVTRLSSNVIVALVSLSPQAAVGLRAVDVVNTDQTNTGFGAATAMLGSGTSQPFRVLPATSLGAPLSVVTLEITHPRNGTLVMQGDDLNAEAILAGTGSGTVIGAWLWDGNVTEQFAAVFAGGQRATLKTRRSLPTSFLGPHTLELRITQPNQLLSRPVEVIVNPGNWQLQRLIDPGYGAAFTADSPPVLRWAPVPGAAKYQVGFSSRPYFSTVDSWHDATDSEWRVPPEIWSGLPEGELYWTVRVVETSGETRKPLPMRLMLRVPSGALASVSAGPGLTSAGNALIEWQGLIAKVFYRITVSRDAAGKQPLRRFLTAEPRLDLRALSKQLEPDHTYYWRVEALLPDGRGILTGLPQSFVAPAGPHSRHWPQRSESGRLVLASLRTPAGPAPDIAALIASRSPQPDSTVNEERPLVVVEFKSPFNPAELALMLDETDVTALLVNTETTITYSPAISLANGEHNVNLTLGTEAASWKFIVKRKEAPQVEQAAGPGATVPGTDAEVAPTGGTGARGGPATQPPQAGAAPAETATVHIGPQTQTQISANTQWISGSAPDTNAITFGQQTVLQNGSWRTEVNGSGLVNSILNPEMQRHSFGRFNDYVFRVAYDVEHWGANLRFGIVAPALYTDSQFVTTATPREGVEATVRTPAGSFAFYANTNDAALGGGSGVTFHQQLMGASWTAPLPKKWADFRLMWLSAHDVGSPTAVMFDSMGNPIVTPNPVASASGGDAYGGLLNFHLGPKWLWSSEYSWSLNNPNLSGPKSRRLFGRAWRTGITGTVGKTAISVIYRDVGPNFATPTNPSLSSLSNPDRRGVDSTVAQPTFLGTFTLGYSFLESNIRQTDRPAILLHNLTGGWAKNLDPKTVVAIQVHEVRTMTGNVPAAVKALPPDQQRALEADQRDLGGNVTVTRAVGKVSLTVGAARDWFRNHLVDKANVITSSLLIGANWNAASFFQLNSNVSLTWVAGERSSVGGTRSISAYLQPTLTWKRAQLQAAPLASINQMRTELGTGILTADLLTGQYGGRVVWKMPGEFQFSTLSLEGSLTQSRNGITAMNVRDKRLLLLWTLVWGHKTAI